MLRPRDASALSGGDAIDALLAIHAAQRRVEAGNVAAGQQLADAGRRVRQISPAPANDCTRAAMFTVWPK